MASDCEAMDWESRLEKKMRLTFRDFTLYSVR